MVLGAVGGRILDDVCFHFLLMNWDFSFGFSCYRFCALCTYGFAGVVLRGLGSYE